SSVLKRIIMTKTCLCASLCCASLLLSVSHLRAARAAAVAPDLTKGGKKTTEFTWNLGPTGARGWIYNQGFDTSAARQILVTEVEKGSPADGVLAQDDVILGINGKLFDSDPRTAFGHAITQAEMETNQGLLKLVCWRTGQQKEVTIKLKVMGSYSETAPYHCEKSKKTLEQGCQAILKRGLQTDLGNPLEGGPWEPSVDSSVNALALLATGNPEYLEVLKAHAHKLAPPGMKLRIRGENEGLDTWSWGYGNLLLTEYYLATKDAYVLPGIRELSSKIALGQSAVGTWGHGFVVPRNNGNLGGYGAINQTGLICWLSLVLAQKCGINDPVVQKAVAKSQSFFGFYSGKGSVPYGDHPPYWLHDDNGKSAAAGVVFDLLGDQAGSRFFSRMATAAYAEKELGHTGNYLGYLWGAMGANRAGPEAVAAFLKEQRWYYDLARRWDGSFRYQGGAAGGDSFDGWDMTGVFVLHYALPLQKLWITGKGINRANRLAGRELQEVLASGRDFNLGPVDTAFEAKSTDQLLKDLGNWSPTMHKRAAAVLAKRPDDVVPQLIRMLKSKDLNARYGACLALEYLERRAAPATDDLIPLLSDKDMWLRIRAAFALSSIGEPARKAVPQLLRMTVRVDKDDPRGIENKYIGFALFKADYVDNLPRADGLLAKSVDGVDRALLYPAIQRLLKLDDGLGTFGVRSVFKTLSPEEMKTFTPTLVQVGAETAPSGEMFAQEIRVCAIQFLAQNKIPEGMQVCIEYARTQNGWGSRTIDVLKILKTYGPAARAVLPELKELQQKWKAQEKEEKGETRSGVAEELIKTIEG
ncbi:MAG: DUF6288 domain-containing protein, partial [Verrucomicrobia bacterium]|nr:DUF6288 domain-containing protein [Verrucomicrobiota bacterium]